MRAQGTAPADAPRPPHETLFYTSAGLRLEAYLFTPQGPGPFPLVVYNHGSRAGQERVEAPFYYVAELLVPNGYAVLVPERRGYGKSEGATFAEEIGDDRGPKFVVRLRAEAEDVGAGVDEVTRRPGSRIDPKRVAVMGWSFGGIITTLAASGRGRFVAAIVQAPGSLNWDRSADLRAALIDAARGIRVPTACAVAENDRTTASAKVICDAINANGTATELKVYPPFTPPQPAPNGVPGHAIFGRAGVPIWGRDALGFLARYVR